MSECVVLSLKSSHYIEIPSLSDEYQRQCLAKHTKRQIKSTRSVHTFVSISMPYNSFLHSYYALDALLFGIRMTYKHNMYEHLAREYERCKAMKMALLNAAF